MVTKLQTFCKIAVEDYQDLNMYKLNLVLYFADKLYRFKYSERFFDEEFLIDEEMGPYLESVKDAYETYSLFNIPLFGALNIFDESDLAMVDKDNKFVEDEKDRNHDVVVDEYGTILDIKFENKKEQDIYNFIKATLEPLDFTGVLYLYESSKDKEEEFNLFLASKFAAYQKWVKDGKPEPDKTKPIKENVMHEAEISVDDIAERISRRKKM